MKTPKFMKPIVNAATKIKLKAVKHSPEILLVTGLVGIAGAVATACYATTKASEVLAESQESINMIHKAADTLDADTYSDNDKKKDLVLTYTKTGINLAKLYIPCAAFTGMAVASFLASHNIMKKRNVALAAAYATVDTGFKDYRDRVIDRFGGQVDKELRYNIKAKEVTETEVDEKTGKEHEVSKVMNVAEIDKYSSYARVFDESNDNWEKDPEYNLMFLRSRENWANEYLRSHRILFLNDVYKALGFEPTKAGQIMGWVYDPDNPDADGDNFVDFGIYNITTQKKRDFVNGYERSIILDFNVDGNVLDKI